MTLKAKHYTFTDNAISSISTYDSTKLITGSLFVKNTGSLNKENWIGPNNIALVSPFSNIATSATTFITSKKCPYDDDLYDIFLMNIRYVSNLPNRLHYYQYNKKNNKFSYQGFTGFNFPATTATLIYARSFQIIRNFYTTGTVQVNGIGVTGSSTLWSTDRLYAGSRIGFGSTDPKQITRWTRIASIQSDTNLTLTGSWNTNYTASTPYVIEDFMIPIAIQHLTTTTSGGLYVARGISIEDLQNQNTNTIPSAGSTDRVLGVYHHYDDKTAGSKIINPSGMVVGDFISWQSQSCYYLDGTTSERISVFNLRESLIGQLSTSGTTNFSYRFTTGDKPFTANQQYNCATIATAKHGPGSGSQSIYFVASTGSAYSICRASIPSITNGNTNWLDDRGILLTPGKLSASAPSVIADDTAYNGITYDSNTDRFFLSGQNLIYSGLYSSSLENSFGASTRLIQSQASRVSFLDANEQNHVSIAGGGTVGNGVDVAGEYLFITDATAGANNYNNVYSVPIQAHSDYENITKQYIILPKFDVSGATKFYNAYVNEAKTLGTDTFEISTEKYNLYYRTSGIDNNSGSWTYLSSSKDLSSVSASNEIQFKLTFNISENTCMPARIYSLSLLYEDAGQTDYYEPSIDKTTTGSFVYRQVQKWNSNIPDLKIIAKDFSNTVIIEDTTNSPVSGTWQYSINGTTWNSWDNTKDTVGNYIKYSPTVVPTGSIRAKLIIN